VFFIHILENHHQVEGARHEPSLVAVVAAANSIAHLWECDPVPHSAGAFDPVALLEILRQFLPQLSAEQARDVVEGLTNDHANWLQLLPRVPSLPVVAAEFRRAKEEVQ
jgi:hypothetical protein